MMDLSMADVKGIAEARHWRQMRNKVLISICVLAVCLLSVLVPLGMSDFSREYVTPNGDTLVIKGSYVILDGYVLERVNPRGANSRAASGVAVALLMVFLGWLVYVVYSSEKYKERFVQQWIDGNKEIPEDK